MKILFAPSVMGCEKLKAGTEVLLEETHSSLQNGWEIKFRSPVKSQPIIIED